ATIGHGIHSEHEHGKDWSRFNELRAAEGAEAVERQIDREMDRQVTDDWEAHLEAEGLGIDRDRESTDQVEETAIQDYLTESERVEIHQEGDVFAVLVSIPDEIQKDYSISDLEDCGVDIE